MWMHSQNSNTNNKKKSLQSKLSIFTTQDRRGRGICKTLKQFKKEQHEAVYSQKQGVNNQVLISFPNKPYKGLHWSTTPVYFGPLFKFVSQHWQLVIPKNLLQNSNRVLLITLTRSRLNKGTFRWYFGARMCISCFKPCDIGNKHLFQSQPQL